MRTLPRIASLVPAATDIVAALGLSEGLVGVSHECDHPVARGKPVLTSSRLPTEGERLSPERIDERVRDAAGRGEPLYAVDRQALAELAPDVVISQSICDVCAVDAGRVDLPKSARMVDLTATTIDGLYADMVRVGTACEREQSALEIVESVRTRLDAVADNLQGEEPVAALALEWSAPPFVGGHWVPEMFSIAGAEHVEARPGERSHRVEWRDVFDADPEVLVVMPCGYGIDDAAEEATRLAPDLAQLRAGRARRIWAANANALFSRCTPHSIARGTEVLAGITQPAAAPPPKSHEARRIEV